MKKNILKLFLILPIISLSANSLTASFADSQWDGKIVPEDMVCSDYNMEAGSTPELIISNIPKSSDKIVLAFSDETFKGMRNGGHGIISYSFKKGLKEITIPAMEGETFDLPNSFKSITPHKAVKYGKPEGAYLAPCSGGKGNTYSVKIEALSGDKILATTNLTLGKY